MRIPLPKYLPQRKVAELTVKHSNLPERYIRRQIEEVHYKAPKLPNYRQINVIKTKKNFGLDPPWSLEFQMKNKPREKHKKIWVEPILEWTIFRGDRVEVLTGKDKGKQGIVIEIVQERNWVIVEGINMYLSVVGKTNTFPGLLVQREAPLLVTTDVALVDPSDLKPVKVNWRYDEDGNKVRVSERTGRIIPISVMEEETYDYKLKKAYVEQKKDTTATEVARITFVPNLETFEMSIMEEQGIKEDRVPAKKVLLTLQKKGGKVTEEEFAQFCGEKLDLFPKFSAGLETSLNLSEVETPELSFKSSGLSSKTTKMHDKMEETDVKRKISRERAIEKFSSL
ncbi:hypothetical protein RUM44_011433 [Polyplax serrata]|uniref:Large ribosomal subunit protein uL24m n=1 Tax=Polyplax serrata TaxID=468196 RepID=A0ABR1ARK1_POLSC